jgi:hypothetical protein
MWTAIGAILTAVLGVLAKWLEARASSDTMAKAYFEAQNKELIEKVGKAYEKPDSYYNGDPTKLIGWVRKRSESESDSVTKS